MPELGYGEFSKLLHEKVANQRIPISGSLELTYRCNIKCQHCYVTHCQPDYSDQKELTLKEIQAIIDQVVDEGCLWFLLTGGEPLMRPDFLEIYQYLKRKGLLVSLFTNGTLLTPRLADTLVEWRPFSIEITLYGASQETYERVTGIPGSYKHCMRGIDLIMERGLPLKLKTMLITLNQHELCAMQAFAESLGMPFRYDAMLNSQINGVKTPQTFRLAPSEVVKYDKSNPNRFKGLIASFERYQDFQVDQRYLYACGAGNNSFHIDPYGKLSMCMMARAQQYDLRSGSFREGWREFLLGVRQQPPHGKYECQTCELLPVCGQCPGWSELESGDSQQRVDFLCQVAHLRADAVKSAQLQSI